MERLDIKLTRRQRDQCKDLIAEYESAGKPRHARRFRAILAFSEAHSLHECCRLSDAPLPSVQRWLTHFRRSGGRIEALRPKSPPGRPAGLTDDDLVELSMIIASGPEKAGYDTGVWTGPLVSELIRKKFKVRYTRVHVTRILHLMGFSCQKPAKRLAKAAPPIAQQKWLKLRWPRVRKTPHGTARSSSSRTKSRHSGRSSARSHNA